MLLFLLACPHPTVAPPVVVPVSIAPAQEPLGYLPRGPVSFDARDTVVGNASAPMAILEFSDFQCPHCALTYPILSDYVEKFKDTRLIYKNYPITNICNPNVAWEGHINACTAATAGICAEAQGHFDALARQMFAHPDRLMSEQMLLMAGEAGIELEPFMRCLTSEAPAAQLKADIQAASEAGITGTPTLYVWGPWGDRWVQVPGPDLVIQVMDLARAHQTLPEPQPAQRE